MAQERPEPPEHRTPRAGERVVATLFGKPVVAEARDRGRITYLSLSAALLPDGPDGLGFSPQGGAYLSRVPADGTTRLRAIVAVLANEVRWDRAVRRVNGGVVSGVVTFDSLTLPWARSEYVEGERVRDEELKTYQARLGLGAAWRRPLGPGAVDNGLDIALALEGGGLWFARGDRTDARFVLPRTAVETRLHLRIRADALERNLLELPHRGVSAGLDLVAANRSRWDAWGMSGLETGGKSWQSASGYAFAALGVPGAGERHRVMASAHAGAGADLDRFSAFRLGSGSTWGDFETLSRAIVPSAGVDEIAARHYAIADLEYRYEALFFLYLQLRGTLAWVERAERTGGRRDTSRAPLPAVTAGLTTGLPWNLAMELAGTYGFGLSTPREGRVEKGRFGLLVSVTKELPW